MKLSELKIISRKLAKMAVFAIVVMIAVVFPANGQSEGQWGISASGAYSMPIGSLSVICLDSTRSSYARGMTRMVAIVDDLPMITSPWQIWMGMRWN